MDVIIIKATLITHVNGEQAVDTIQLSPKFVVATSLPSALSSGQLMSSKLADACCTSASVLASPGTVLIRILSKSPGLRSFSVS